MIKILNIKMYCLIDTLKERCHLGDVKVGCLFQQTVSFHKQDTKFYIIGNKIGSHKLLNS